MIGMNKLYFYSIQISVWGTPGHSKLFLTFFADDTRPSSSATYLPADSRLCDETKPEVQLYTSPPPEQGFAMHGKPSYSCCVCNKKFTLKNKCERHMLKHLTDNRPFTCQYCDKSFDRKDHCKSHEYTHTGEKPYTCKFCEKRFKDSSTCKSHEAEHSGERFYCLSCSKPFVHKNDLKRHQLIHTG